MKLSLKAVALTTGLLWAGYILLVGVINLADPHYGAGFLALTSSLYPGLHFVHRWETLLGVTITALWMAPSGIAICVDL